VDAEAGCGVKRGKRSAGGRMRSQVEYEDILAVAIIAAGMYANLRSSEWTAEEIANDAIASLKEIKRQILG
jgi:hypothetical protein